MSGGFAVAAVRIEYRQRGGLVLQAAASGPPAGVAAARPARDRCSGRGPDRRCCGDDARCPFGGWCAGLAGRAGMAVPVHHRSWASGWFLFPTAFLLLAIAAADSAALPDFSRHVLAAISIRIGFIFMAIAVPGLFVAVIKRLIGRARPFVAGEDAWTSQFLVWRPDYASFPSGHATTAFAAAIAIGALWPRLAPCDVDLCRRHRGKPGDRHGASSERRYCRCCRRRGRCAAGAQLVCRATAGLCGRR